MIAAERLRRISERLRTEPVVSIAALSEMLGVSDMTIRRDLAQLARMGLCRRERGGAASTRALTVQDVPYNQRESLHVAEKTAIGRAAARMVNDGETIAIDAGTTTAQMAAALAGRQNITVITNSLRVLSHLSNSPGITVISTGGTVSTAPNEDPGRADPCLVGPLAEANMRRFRPTKAFMGTTGLTLGDGLSNSILEQAELKRVMIEVSAEVILLADHTKFGQVASCVVGSLTLLQRIVTDTAVSPQMKQSLQQLGIEVITVEPATNHLG